MSNHEPITEEELVEMKALAEADTWAVGYRMTLARFALPRCIAEIERLKEEVSTLRQLREYDAKDLLEHKMKNLNL